MGPTPPVSLAPRNAPARIDIVDALRGVAALGVAWFHIVGGLDAPSLLKLSGAYGWVGVDVFFVLSGFVIPYSMSRYPGGYALGRFPSFMARRAIRIEIPYLASIIATLGAVYAASLIPGSGWPTPDFEPARILRHAFYLVPFTDDKWIQPVYWTLAFEFAFYVAIGLFYPVVVGERSRARFAVASVAVCALVVAAAPFSEAPDRTVRTVLFIMGLAICRVRVSGDEARFAWLIIAIAAIAMASLDAFVGAAAGVATSAILMRIVTTGAASPARPSILSGLGAISYSLYVTHFVVFALTFGPIGALTAAWPLAALLQCLLTLALCLAAACGFYLAVERPAQRLSKSVPIKRARRADHGAPAELTTAAHQ